MSYFIASCERLEVETAARCGQPLLAMAAI